MLWHWLIMDLFPDVLSITTSEVRPTRAAALEIKHPKTGYCSKFTSFSAILSFRTCEMHIS